MSEITTLGAFTILSMCLQDKLWHGALADWKDMAPIYAW